MIRIKPIIGITIGEPAGIGSEIAIKLIADDDVYRIGRPLLIGSRFLIEEGKRIARVNRKGVAIGDEEVDRLKYSNKEFYYIDCDNIGPGDFQYGQISAKAGKASGEYIAKGVRLALRKKIDAIVTCPINKESFALGGWGKRYAGHTEMLADLTGTNKYAMMLAHGNLRVVHVSTHTSLRKAIEACKIKRVFETIQLAAATCKKLEIKSPRVGVAGLNPHAGEGGLFGKEEIKEIIPAVKMARKAGLDVTGPIPSDTIFCKAKGGMYDVIVAMYHDQGHIPLKFAGFVYDERTKSWNVRGVNITIGLPIIRVSVDHGTAFGKAGKGRADYSSLKDAFIYAARMAINQ
jgi:4-hydroxythreonine-4-phosphate dehydrogenase